MPNQRSELKISSETLWFYLSKIFSLVFFFSLFINNLSYLEICVTKHFIFVIDTSLRLVLKSVTF